MLLLLFVKGLIIGFCAAAPVGPVGVLCINRSLHDGFKAGMISGLGAACADCLFGGIAGFGLTFIANFLQEQQVWLKLTGGIFLIIIGIKTLLVRPPKQLLINNSIAYGQTFATTFFLTLTNPLSILVFVAAFAGLGIAGTTRNDYWYATSLIIGIGLGSFIWWIVLSSIIVTFIRHRTNSNFLYWINFASGIMIILFGIMALCSLMIKWHIPVH